VSGTTTGKSHVGFRCVRTRNLEEKQAGFLIITWMMTRSPDRRIPMFRNTRVQMAAVLAAGALLGYLAATGSLNPLSRAGAT
jgi:hypothetical protein